MNGAITSPFAKGALKRGIRSAKLDYRRPPMKNCDLIRRILYQRRQRKIIDLAHSGKRQGLSHLSDGYQFEVLDEVKVIFACPTCGQKLRLPIRKNIQVHCSVCQSSFACQT